MWNIFKNRAEPVKVDKKMAIAMFMGGPAEFFTHREEPYEWPAYDEKSTRPVDFESIRVVVGGYTMGFVERMQCFNGTAYVKHIAMAKDFAKLKDEQGKKLRLGNALARALAAQLRSRYRVNKIVFQEDHSKYEEAGYDAFFRGLGANPLPTGPGQRPDRPDFEWLEANWKI